jgi:hypothetical protein
VLYVESADAVVHYRWYQWTYSTVGELVGVVPFVGGVFNGNARKTHHQSTQTNPNPQAKLSMQYPKRPK